MLFARAWSDARKHADLWRGPGSIFTSHPWPCLLIHYYVVSGAYVVPNLVYLHVLAGILHNSLVPSLPHSALVRIQVTDVTNAEVQRCLSSFDVFLDVERRILFAQFIR